MFPGSPGWTVVKTAPFELLGERAPGARRMRLVELAVRLGVEACQVNLYGSSALVLVEADRTGRCVLSGYCAHSAALDPLRFHQEQIAEERVGVRFEVLSLRHLVEASRHQEQDEPWLDSDDLVERLAETLGGSNAAWCDNRTMVDVLIPHAALPTPGGIELYFEWPARDRRAELPRSPPGLQG